MNTNGFGRMLATFAVAGVALACTPRLVPPEEAVRVVGKVVPEEVEESGSVRTARTAGDPRAEQDGGMANSSEEPKVPVRVVVHERCSPRFVLFKDCPGKRLGEAKIPKPGPFLIDVDTQRDEIVVFAWPEGSGAASPTCGAVTKNVNELGEPLQVPLSGSECPRRQPLYY